MTRKELKAERASEVLRAFEDGKAVEWRQRGAVASWKSATAYGCDGDRLSFDFEHYQYRIAKERQFLPSIESGDGINGISYACHIDSDGLHVGCTTISFERVREIALACRRWQSDGQSAQKSRLFFLKQTGNKDWGTNINGNGGGWVAYGPMEHIGRVDPGEIWVREVLPGEEEI